MPTLGQTTIPRTLTVRGRERSYRIYYPKDYSAIPTVRRVSVGGQVRTLLTPAIKYPVVFAFHGGSGNAAIQAFDSRMNESADKYKYVVIYCNGTGGTALPSYTWNALSCCGYAQLNHIDDLAYFDAVLAQLPSLVNMDSTRVYATGFSNGAMFCHLLAARRSSKIAAIGPVSGDVPVLSIRPTRRMPVISFHGALDQHIPYDGGVGDDALFPVPHNSIPASVLYWVEANSCSTTPTLVTADDYVRASYAPPSGTPASLVVHYELPGGGHTWPGGQVFEEGALGPLIETVPASDLILQFFSRFTRPF